jgi:hypothetical protein
MSNILYLPYDQILKPPRSAKARMQKITICFIGIETHD